jgi:uncharacterized LabA/DUF88 family protein
MDEHFSILLDGGFVKKKLGEQLHRFPAVTDVQNLCTRVTQHGRLIGKELFRVYYYDAPPFEGVSQNPIDGTVLRFANTPQAAQNKALIDSLELQPDFAVRRGTIVQSGWKLGRMALRSLAQTQRPITARDLVPDMAQKGVDIRIGLDIAWIALKRLVTILVLVTGDSDFVPVMKFARREGLKVYLETMGHPVRRELKAHADLVF